MVCQGALQWLKRQRFFHPLCLFCCPVSASWHILGTALHNHMITFCPSCTRSHILQEWRGRCFFFHKETMHFWSDVTYTSPLLHKVSGSYSLSVSHVLVFPFHACSNRMYCVLLWGRKNISICQKLYALSVPFRSDSIIWQSRMKKP